MLPPMISLLVAGSVQFATEVRAPEDLAFIAIEGARSFSTAPAPELESPEGHPAPRLCAASLPGPRPLPAAPRVTYDWRSPVFFDFP